MIHHCAIATSNVNAVQRPDGSWTAEGVAAEKFVDTILLMERAAKPANSTFYVTLNADECLQRIMKNESYFSNVFIPLHTVSPYFHATVTILTGINQFISGYNTSENLQSAEDQATVFTNVGLLDPDVYLWSVVLLISLFCFTVSRVFIHYQALIRWRRVKMSLRQIIARELTGVFYLSNDHFKLITLLYAIFSFYLVTSFLCIYKTSHVIAEKPFYPTSYLESLEYKTSLAGFYNQFVVVSKGFEDAPPRSLRGRLWKKLMASGQQNPFRVGQESASLATLPTFMSRITVAVVSYKWIGVASSITIPLLKSLACGFSPEGQLWFLKVFSDPSEQEVIYGYATAKHFLGAHKIRRNLQRAFEGDIMRQHYRTSTDVTHIANRYAATSKQHQWKQYLACNHEDALIPDVQVHAVPLSYFCSFFSACAVVWTAAFIINLSQIMYSKRNNCIRRGRKRIGTCCSFRDDSLQ